MHIEYLYEPSNYADEMVKLIRDDLTTSQQMEDLYKGDKVRFLKDFMTKYSVNDMNIIRFMQSDNKMWMFLADKIRRFTENITEKEKNGWEEIKVTLFKFLNRAITYQDVDKGGYSVFIVPALAEFGNVCVFLGDDEVIHQFLETIINSRNYDVKSIYLDALSSFIKKIKSTLSNADNRRLMMNRELYDIIIRLLRTGDISEENRGKIINLMNDSYDYIKEYARSPCDAEAIIDVIKLSLSAPKETFDDRALSFLVKICENNYDLITYNAQKIAEITMVYVYGKKKRFEEAFMVWKEIAKAEKKAEENQGLILGIWDIFFQCVKSVLKSPDECYQNVATEALSCIKEFASVDPEEITRTIIDDHKSSMLYMNKTEHISSYRLLSAIIPSITITDEVEVFYNAIKSACDDIKKVNSTDERVCILSFIGKCIKYDSFLINSKSDFNYVLVTIKQYWKGEPRLINKVLSVAKHLVTAPYGNISFNELYHFAKDVEKTKTLETNHAFFAFYDRLIDHLPRCMLDEVVADLIKQIDDCDFEQPLEFYINTLANIIIHNDFDDSKCLSIRNLIRKVITSEKFNAPSVLSSIAKLIKNKKYLVNSEAKDELTNIIYNMLETGESNSIKNACELAAVLFYNIPMKVEWTLKFYDLVDDFINSKDSTIVDIRPTVFRAYGATIIALYERRGSDEFTQEIVEKTDKIIPELVKKEEMFPFGGVCREFNDHDEFVEALSVSVSLLTYEAIKSVKFFEYYRLCLNAIKKAAKRGIYSDEIVKACVDLLKHAITESVDQIKFIRSTDYLMSMIREGTKSNDPYTKEKSLELIEIIE